MKKKGIAGKPVVLFLFHAKAQIGNTKGAKKQMIFCAFAKSLRLCVKLLPYAFQT